MGRIDIFFIFSNYMLFYLYYLYVYLYIILNIIDAFIIELKKKKLSLIKKKKETTQIL